MYRSLRHPIEAFRTAPVQITGSALNFSIGIFAIEAAQYMHESASTPVRAAELGFAALNFGVAALQVAVAKENIDLRNRLELILDRHGFDERAMGKTTRTYCKRQAAIIACENYDYSDEYSALCARNSDTAAFTWLPHI